MIVKEIHEDDAYFREKDRYLNKEINEFKIDKDHGNGWVACFGRIDGISVYFWEVKIN